MQFNDEDTKINNKIQLFQDHKVRTLWDEEQEECFFSIVDVVRVLTDQPTQDSARNYWKVLKNRLKKEGNETVTNRNQLKMQGLCFNFECRVKKSII